MDSRGQRSAFHEGWSMLRNCMGQDPSASETLMRGCPQLSKSLLNPDLTCCVQCAVPPKLPGSCVPPQSGSHSGAEAAAGGVLHGARAGLGRALLQSHPDWDLRLRICGKCHHGCRSCTVLPLAELGPVIWLSTLPCLCLGQVTACGPWAE